MVIIAVISGVALGITIASIVQVNRINDLLKDVYKAEDRAIKHFNRLCKIDKILKDADKNKETYRETIQKIKKVV